VDIILTIGGVVGALVVIVGGLISVYKIARKVDEAIGQDTDGRTLADRLSRVEHQLWENGGSSLADRVNRIEMHSATTATEVAIIKEILINSVVAAPSPKTRQRKARANANLSIVDTDK
jgi:hypothetical protein